MDFAQLVNLHGSVRGKSSEVRYSPAECTGIRKRTVEVYPDAAENSNSYVERQSLTMRMHVRRFA